MRISAGVVLIAALSLASCAADDPTAVVTDTVSSTTPTTTTIAATSTSLGVLTTTPNPDTNTVGSIPTIEVDASAPADERRLAPAEVIDGGETRLVGAGFADRAVMIALCVEPVVLDDPILPTSRCGPASETLQLDSANGTTFDQTVQLTSAFGLAFGDEPLTCAELECSLVFTTELASPTVIVPLIWVDSAGS